MGRANREYQIRPMVCDWALDIPMGDTTFVLHFNSRNNAELVKAILEWEDLHPNEAIPYQPTLTPPNEPLTLDGWVSVKDGLPKENKRVLVHVVNASTLDVDTDRIVGGQWVRWAGSITHWMLLPELPTEKKEDK